MLQQEDDSDDENNYDRKRPSQPSKDEIYGPEGYLYQLTLYQFSLHQARKKNRGE